MDKNKLEKLQDFCKVPIHMQIEKGKKNIHNLSEWDEVIDTEPTSLIAYQPFEKLPNDFIIEGPNRNFYIKLAELPIEDNELFKDLFELITIDKPLKQLIKLVENDLKVRKRYLKKLKKNNFITLAAATNTSIKLLRTKFEISVKTWNNTIVRIAVLSKEEVKLFFGIRSLDLNSQRKLLKDLLGDSGLHNYSLDIVASKKAFEHYVIADAYGLAMDFNPVTLNDIKKLKDELQLLQNQVSILSPRLVKELEYLTIQLIEKEKTLDKMHEYILRQYADDYPLEDITNISTDVIDSLRDNAIREMRKHLVSDPQLSCISIPLTRKREYDEIATLIALAQRAKTLQLINLPFYLKNINVNSSLKNMRRSAKESIRELKKKGYVFHHSGKLSIDIDGVLINEIQIIDRVAHQYFIDIISESVSSMNVLSHVGGAYIYRKFYGLNKYW